MASPAVSLPEGPIWQVALMMEYAPMFHRREGLLRSTSASDLPRINRTERTAPNSAVLDIFKDDTKDIILTNSVTRGCERTCLYLADLKRRANGENGLRASWEIGNNVLEPRLDNTGTSVYALVVDQRQKDEPITHIVHYDCTLATGNNPGQYDGPIIQNESRCIALVLSQPGTLPIYSRTFFQIGEQNSFILHRSSDGHFDIFDNKGTHQRTVGLVSNGVVPIRSLRPGYLLGKWATRVYRYNLHQRTLVSVPTMIPDQVVAMDSAGNLVTLYTAPARTGHGGQIIKYPGCPIGSRLAQVMIEQNGHEIAGLSPQSSVVVILVDSDDRVIVQAGQSIYIYVTEAEKTDTVGQITPTAGGRA